MHTSISVLDIAVRQALQRLVERRWLPMNADALKPLVQHTIRAAMKRQLGARELANVAHGGSHVWKSIGLGNSADFRQSLSEMFAAMAKKAVQLLD